MPKDPAQTELTTPDARTIRTERVFDADRDALWRAFTDPVLLARWWARGNPVTIETLVLAPGGHWRYVEHASEGDEGFEGRFREVSVPERLVQTFEWDGMPGYPSVTTTLFEAVGAGRTRVVTEAQFMTQEERDGMLAEGMRDGLERSYSALESLLRSMR
jgi:uncharacterized protein YndB with AHSA1/START domain